MAGTNRYGAAGMTDASDSRPPMPSDPLYAGGTGAIVAGTAVAALSVYLVQVIAGRSLGAAGFAPLGIILTAQFLIFTVLYIPVEQYVTRQLVLSGREWAADRHTVVTVATPLVIGVAIGVLFVVATSDRFFEGTLAFAAVLAALLASRAVASLARGHLAGARRFRTYGVMLGAEAALAVSLSALVALTHPTPLTFAAVLPIAPLVILLARPFSTTVDLREGSSGVRAGPAFLWALVGATAASQIILASGPVVVGLVGGSAAIVSIVFVTFSLFRGPVTSSYGLIARVLPDFTAIAAAGEQHRLSRWGRWIGLAGAAAALLFGVLGWVLGPVVIEFLYGPGFVPSSQVAALAAAAVGFALASLFLNQIYVARGETGRLAAIWWGALLVGILALLVFPGEPSERVAVSFLIGEATAMVLLLVAGSILGDRSMD